MSANLTADSVVQIAPPFRLQWEAAQGAYVLLYPEGMVRLNPSAGEILRRCDGARDIAAIVRELQQAFPEVDLAQDVNEFMEVAYERRWIRPVGP